MVLDFYLRCEHCHVFFSLNGLVGGWDYVTFIVRCYSNLGYERSRACHFVFAVSYGLVFRVCVCFCFFFMFASHLTSILLSYETA